jgi:hypothetical protein
LKALRIVERQRGLKPAGDGIGQIRNQAPRLHLHHEPLALPCMESKTVDVTGHDLPVQQHG